MLEFENYSKEKLSITLVQTSIFGLLLLILTILIFGLPYYMLWHSNSNIISLVHDLLFLETTLNDLWLFFFLFLGAISYELIHGIIWAMFTNNGFKSIKFGIIKKTSNFYCHCKEPLNTKQYILGSIAPAITLGLFPSILAILIGNFSILIFGVFFTIMASKDLLITNLLRKENSTSLVQNTPSKTDFYIYRKI